MAKRTPRKTGGSALEPEHQGRGRGNCPVAQRRRERTWPATVTLHLRKGMEPISGMPNVGTLPSLNPPRHDEQGRLALPFATGTERLQARVVMHSLCGHYLATLEAPAEPPTLEAAPELAERMADEIRLAVQRLRNVNGWRDLEVVASEWLHTLDARWKVARTTDTDTPFRFAEWPWTRVYGERTALELVESVADRLGVEMAERATALVTLLVDEPLRAAVLTDPDLVARWPWAASRLLVGGDTFALAETTWPGVDSGATFEAWRDVRMARAILRAGERMTEAPWPHTGWPGKAAPDDVVEWLKGDPEKGIPAKGRRPPSLRFEGVEWPLVQSPWFGTDNRRHHSWASQYRHAFDRPHQREWPHDLHGNPVDWGDGLRPVERLWLAARVLAGGVPAHEFDARDNGTLVLTAERQSRNERQARSVAEANYVEDALRHNRTWPPNLTAKQVRRLERANRLLRRQHFEKREPSPRQSRLIEDAWAILDAAWRAEDERLEGLRRLPIGGQTPDPEWAGWLDLEVGGVDPRNDYKYTSRSWALHVSELPYQALALIHVLEARAKESREVGRLRRKRLKLAPLATDGYIKAPADRINMATIEAFAPGAMRELTEEEGNVLQLSKRGTYWRAHVFGQAGGELSGAVGFPRDPGEAIWKLLQDNGALAVKAQYALWARAYNETDADPERFVMMSIPAFCTDLGYKQHKGSHKLKNKQAAMEVLELLTSIELDAIFQPSGKKARRLRGLIWVRGVTAEELDNYGDLWGANRVGDPAVWEPVAFAYAPGMFFRDQEWRTRNKNVAMIGAGLLELDTNRDKWAIMVGGYLGMVARMNKYKSRVLRVETLLTRTRLYDADRKHPGRVLDKLETALNRLQAVGVIGSWSYLEGNEIEEPDMDDSEVVANLRNYQDDRARWRIRIEWPDELNERERELSAKTTKRIQSARTRKARKTPPA